MVEKSASSKIKELKVELRKFERRYIDGKDVVFYIVLVCSGRRKWKLDKRFNDFYDLDA